MNLARLRVRLTLLYGLLSALAVGALAVVAIRTGTARILETAERDVQQLVTSGQQEGADDTWYVDTADGAVEELGESSVEPPVFTLAEAAVEYDETFLRFGQEGVEFLAYARQVDDTAAVVGVMYLDDYLASARALTLSIALSAVAAVLLATAAGWWLAGRSLHPARQAMDQQRDFLADAAHELRTPLAIIQASASSALSRERPAEGYVRSLVEIREAAARAATGVAELLELARLEAGQEPPRRSPLRLDLLAEEVVSATRVDGCVVELRPGPAVVVAGDLALLRQAIDNLVRNAARRATHVTLTTAVDGGEAVVEVTDNGPGFDPRMLAHAFERFRRGDEQGSSGLGLAIVRRIVTAHGGRCQAANADQGGAVVRMRLPL